RREGTKLRSSPRATSAHPTRCSLALHNGLDDVGGRMSKVFRVVPVAPTGGSSGPVVGCATRRRFVTAWLLTLALAACSAPVGGPSSVGPSATTTTTQPRLATDAEMASQHG